MSEGSVSLVVAYARSEWLSWMGRLDGAELPWASVEIGRGDDLGDERLPWDRNRDELKIFVRDGRLYITGSNDRAVLFAVYEALRRLGFAWPFPGDDRAVVPEAPQYSALASAIFDVPSFDYRGWAVEGAFDLSELTDYIAWLARHRYNHVHFQFTDLRTFFLRRDDTLDQTKIEAWDKAGALEVKKRGLILHRGGHGFLTQVFGIDSFGWDPHEGSVPKEVGRWSAEVNKKRTLYRDIAAFTHLCFSQPEVVNCLEDVLVEYAQQNVDVDVLDFWLADGINNWCECIDCKSKRPADLYMPVVRRLAEKLGHLREGLRLEFISYTSLLQPPEESHSLPDNCTLLFAPWGRSYEHSLGAANEAPDGPYFQSDAHWKFRRFPNNREYAGLYQSWKQKFSRTPGVFFEYHFWSHPWRLARPLSFLRSMQGDFTWMADSDVQGLMACQTPKAFLPDGLGVFCQSQWLWNVEADFEDTVNTYLEQAYGPDAAKARKLYAAVEEVRPGEGESYAALLHKADAPKVRGASVARYLEFLDLNHALMSSSESAIANYEAWYQQHLSQLERESDVYEIRFLFMHGPKWQETLDWNYADHSL